jgi:hypothetical protein
VSGNFIASVDNSSYGTIFTSLDTEYEGQDGEYVIIIDSNSGAGFYNLAIESLDSAPADLAISSLDCPANHTSGSEVQITWELVSLRGSANGVDITLHLDLIDLSGEEVKRLTTKTVAVIGEYNTTFGSDGESYTTLEERVSGMYNCRLTIDVDDDLIESDESNNQETGTPFFIQNEDELWANDVDKDGFNTTDTGDGKIDDCPTTYGNSYIDRVGCADVDEDGVSNLNDLWPFEPNQALDSDGDSYGDNPEGIDGDACPEVAGVPNGLGGDGCPPADTDQDDDGVDNVNDLCPDTLEGKEVGTDGCEMEVEQNNSNANTTLGTNTTEIGNVTDTSNNDTATSGEKEDEGSDTSDGTQSSSEMFGMDTVTLGIVIGATFILLLSLVLIVRGRGNSDKEDKLFDQQQMAYASITGLPPAADPSITPEQLAYEQQLVAAGYPADYARTYADQHFRPWLKA